MYFSEEDYNFKEISSLKFEELCFDLLLKMGFYNLTWRKGGPDNGRDIEANFMVINPLVGHYEEKWFVECKNYSDGVPVTELDSKFAWADAERPDHLLIIVSPYVSNASRVWIDKRKMIVPYRVHLLEGINFKKILLTHEDLVSRYFSSKSAKLLKHTIDGWIYLDILPNGKTINYIRSNLNMNKLNSWEISFLWNSYILSKEVSISELEYDFERLIHIVSSWTNCTKVLTKNNMYRTITMGVGDVYQFKQNNFCVSAKIIVIIDCVEYHALYTSILNEENDSSIEVLLIQSEYIDARISHVKTNANKSMHEIIELLNEYRI